MINSFPLQDLTDENRTLTRLVKRQSLALNRLAGTEGELPILLRAHEETRVLKQKMKQVWNLEFKNCFSKISKNYPYLIYWGSRNYSWPWSNLPWYWNYLKLKQQFNRTWGIYPGLEATYRGHKGIIPNPFDTGQVEINSYFILFQFFLSWRLQIKAF